MSTSYHDFWERLQFSEGVEVTQKILAHLLDHVAAGREIVRATETQDRNGTDYWIRRYHGLPDISIDMKNREFCPIERFGSDDVCIETCSVYRGPVARPWRDSQRYKPGWTLDETKRTDLICFTWPHSADLFGEMRQRFWILYFPHLCRAALAHWREWAARYGERPAANEGYVTLCVYVPRPVVAAAIRGLTNGVTAEGGL